MKVLLDSNVMIASILLVHPQHNKAMMWQNRIVSGTVSGVLAAHTLAETYSSLTRMPTPLRLSPRRAMQAIELNLTYFELVTLTETEVLSVIFKLASRNIGGGQV